MSRGDSLILAQQEILRMQSLNALFEYATEGIIISDKNGLIVKANPSAERLFGYAKNELIGKVIEDLVPHRYSGTHPRDRANFNRKPHARSMGKNLDLYARRKDNTEFPVEISLSFYKTDEGETYVIAFVIDITERKRHEQSIIRLNHELERKVDERTKVLHEALLELEASKHQLSEALVAEKELNDMKSRFVTMASHEFRTPLSTILSSASLIGKYAEHDDRIERHVQRVKSAVTNMTLILNDFLSAEKLDEGKVFVRIERINLPGLVQEILSEVHGIQRKGQQLNYSHSGDETANVDKQMIRNILLNLISNAIKFTPEGKQIAVETSIEQSTVEIKVADEGMGIPEEEQAHMFERFFRAKNATNVQGTGLGLNIVSKYLETLGGSIDFKSRLNEGTTFHVTIPNISKTK